MPRFHVFLSHKSSDKPAVRALKQALAGQGLKCWLDEEQLRPGLPWQDLLEQGIKGSGSVAVCVAADGLGPWEDEEMQALGRRAGMTQAANSAMDFEAYLEGRLAGGERLFLLIGGLGNCADAGREQLADILRGLFDQVARQAPPFRAGKDSARGRRLDASYLGF